MKKVLFVISLFFINVLFAQNSSVKLMGSVVDSLTNEPLEYVNIYLSNTSLGTSTLKNGTFTISKIPAGEYIVYFSCIGYTPIRKTINVTRYSIDIGKIKLAKQEFELEEFAVVGEKQTEWENRLKRFTSLLLGESELSKSCKILNPEVQKQINSQPTKNPCYYSNNKSNKISSNLKSSSFAINICAISSSIKKLNSTCLSICHNNCSNNRSQKRQDNSEERSRKMHNYNHKI